MADYKPAADAYNAIIMRCQEVLTLYLTSDGNDAEQACSELLEILDGPVWREAYAKYAAAPTLRSAENGTQT